LYKKLRVLVEPRKYSKKLAYRGIFKGAKVIRGVDWQWGEQDKHGIKGRVIELRDWNNNSFNSAAYVQWEDNSKNLYRLGHNGMVIIFKFSNFI
jgi:hypothetical protein